MMKSWGFPWPWYVIVCSSDLTGWSNRWTIHLAASGGNIRNQNQKLPNSWESISRCSEALGKKKRAQQFSPIEPGIPCCETRTKPTVLQARGSFRANIEARCFRQQGTCCLWSVPNWQLLPQTYYKRVVLGCTVYDIMVRAQARLLWSTRNCLRCIFGWLCGLAKFKNIIINGRSTVKQNNRLSLSNI